MGHRTEKCFQAVLLSGLKPPRYYNTQMGAITANAGNNSLFVSDCSGGPSSRPHKPCHFEHLPAISNTLPVISNTLPVISNTLPIVSNTPPVISNILSVISNVVRNLLFRLSVVGCRFAVDGCLLPVVGSRWTVIPAHPLFVILREVAGSRLVCAFLWIARKTKRNPLSISKADFTGYKRD